MDRNELLNLIRSLEMFPGNTPSLDTFVRAKDKFRHMSELEFRTSILGLLFLLMADADGNSPFWRELNEAYKGSKNEKS